MRVCVCVCVRVCVWGGGCSEPILRSQDRGVERQRGLGVGWEEGSKYILRRQDR